MHLKSYMDDICKSSTPCDMSDTDQRDRNLWGSEIHDEDVLSGGQKKPCGSVSEAPNVVTMTQRSSISQSGIPCSEKVFGISEKSSGPSTIGVEPCRTTEDDTNYGADVCKSLDEGASPKSARSTQEYVDLEKKPCGVLPKSNVDTVCKSSTPCDMSDIDGRDRHLFESDLVTPVCSHSNGPVIDISSTCSKSVSSGLIGDFPCAALGSSPLTRNILSDYSTCSRSDVGSPDRKRFSLCLPLVKDEDYSDVREVSEAPADISPIPAVIADSYCSGHGLFEGVIKFVDLNQSYENCGHDCRSPFSVVCSLDMSGTNSHVVDAYNSLSLNIFSDATGTCVPFRFQSEPSSPIIGYESHSPHFIKEVTSKIEIEVPGELFLPSSLHEDASKVISDSKHVMPYASSDSFSINPSTVHSIEQPCIVSDPDFSTAKYASITKINDKNLGPVFHCENQLFIDFCGSKDVDTENFISKFQTSPSPDERNVDSQKISNHVSLDCEFSRSLDRLCETSDLSCTSPLSISIVDRVLDTTLPPEALDKSNVLAPKNISQLVSIANADPSLESTISNAHLTVTSTANIQIEQQSLVSSKNFETSIEKKNDLPTASKPVSECNSKMSDFHHATHFQETSKDTDFQKIDAIKQGFQTQIFSYDFDVSVNQIKSDISVSLNDLCEGQGGNDLTSFVPTNTFQAPAHFSLGPCEIETCTSVNIEADKIPSTEGTYFSGPDGAEFHLETEINVIQNSPSDSVCVPSSIEIVNKIDFDDQKVLTQPSAPSTGPSNDGAEVHILQSCTPHGPTPIKELVAVHTPGVAFHSDCLEGSAVVGMSGSHSPLNSSSANPSINTNLEVHINNESRQLDVQFVVDGTPFLVSGTSSPVSVPSCPSDWNIKVECNAAFGLIGTISSQEVHSNSHDSNRSMNNSVRTDS